MRVSFERLLNTLGSLPALSHLKESFLPHLIEITEVRLFKKNEIVMLEGEYEDACCLILSGSVGVWTKNKKGKLKKRCEYKKGDFFGEIATLSFARRIADVKCNEPATLLYMSKNALISLMDHSSEFKRSVYRRYREDILNIVLKRRPLFAELPESFFKEIESVAQIISYKQDETLLPLHDQSNDFFIILHGFARVSIPGKECCQTTGKSLKIAGYLEPGDHFGEIAPLGKRRRVAIIQAITQLDALKIDGYYFETMLEKYFKQSELLRQVIKSRKKQDFIFPDNPEDQKFLDWAISSHMVDSEAVLLIDLNKCVRCETCINTCKLIHGDSRLRLTGYRYKNILIPTSCRHCSDPACLKECPTGAIYRNFSGEVMHKSNCIACNSCVKNCPWHNISLVKRKKHKSRPIFDLFNKKLWKKRVGLRGAPVEVIYKKNRPFQSQHFTPGKREISSIAAKCDNCREYTKMGCVQNCPTGATRRVRPREYFKQLKKEFFQKK